MSSEWHSKWKENIVSVINNYNCISLKLCGVTFTVLGSDRCCFSSGAWKYFILRVEDMWAFFLCKVKFLKSMPSHCFPVLILFILKSFLVSAFCDCPLCYSAALLMVPADRNSLPHVVWDWLSGLLFWVLVSFLSIFFMDNVVLNQSFSLSCAEATSLLPNVHSLAFIWAKSPFILLIWPGYPVSVWTSYGQNHGFWIFFFFSL